MAQIGNQPGARPGRRRERGRILLLLAIIILGILVVSAILVVTGIWSPWTYLGVGELTYSGPVFSFQERETLMFSPDGKMVAYIWRDAVDYQSPEPGVRPKTLEDALEVRWFPVNNPKEESSLSLDAIDLRPDGIVYARIHGLLCFSPDSKYLAAVCARHLYLIDLETGQSREMHFDGEEFGSLAWVEDREIVYATDDRTTVRFWRYRIDQAPDQRVEVYHEKYGSGKPKMYPRPSDNLPSMRHYDYSPDGQTVLFPSRAARKLGLLDLNTGAFHPLLDRASQYCWRPDGSAVLVYGDNGPIGGSREQKVLLVNTADGRIEDLTERFEEICGEDMKLTFVSSQWLPDGKSVVLYNTKSFPHQGEERRKPDQHTSYVVQVDPWRAILAKDGFLRWSPVPGWVLLQGHGDFEWLDYASTTRARLKGWPNDWVWSPGGTHAAEVKGRKVIVFSPQLPPGH